jgi:hypothetical protein
LTHAAGLPLVDWRLDRRMRIARLETVRSELGLWSQSRTCHDTVPRDDAER